MQMSSVFTWPPWIWGLSSGCPVLFNPILQTSQQQWGSLFLFTRGSLITLLGHDCLKSQDLGKKRKITPNLGLDFSLFFVMLSDSGAPVSAGRGCALAGPSRSPGREVRCQPGSRVSGSGGGWKRAPVCGRPSWPGSARLGTPRPEGWLLTHPSRCLRRQR